MVAFQSCSFFLTHPVRTGAASLMSASIDEILRKFGPIGLDHGSSNIIHKTTTKKSFLIFCNTSEFQEGVYGL